MKTLLLALLIPLYLPAAEPIGKKLNLKLAPKADDDTARLKKQAKEAQNPLPTPGGIDVSCTDSAGITHQKGEPGFAKCASTIPNAGMDGSARKYDGPTKNINPNTGTPQTGQGLPSVQIKK